jgi:ABC-type Fe3+-hydroxamate transport system substrate-binding protein
MKRAFYMIAVLLLSVFVFAACGPSSNGNTDIAGVVATLEAEGYTLTSYDAETHEYFASQVNTNYGVTIVVKDMYQGYVMEGSNQTRFVRVVACDNTTQATNYYNALVDEGEVGVYLYKTGTVVVYTNSEATKNLFE